MQLKFYLKLSKHKGEFMSARYSQRKHILKSSKRVCACKQQSTKRQKGEIIYIAPDSCIIFDLCNKMKGRTNSKRSKAYYNNLERLLISSVYDWEGQVKNTGKFAICILPAVMEEMLNEDGVLYDLVKDFLITKTIPLSINPNYQIAFDKKVNQLVTAYNKAGYFVDKQGNPTNDAYIMAQASIFNISIITQDYHFTRETTEASNEKKIEKIKFINRKILGGDFDGVQTEPKQIENFFKGLSKGAKVPTLQNTSILAVQTQEKVSNISNSNPAKKVSFEILREL